MGRGRARSSPYPGSLAVPSLLFMVHEAYHGPLLLGSRFRASRRTATGNCRRNRRIFSRPISIPGATMSGTVPHDQRADGLLPAAARRWGVPLFRRTLPVRLEKDPLRARALPRRSAAAFLSFAAAEFGAAAARFDSYVSGRWGVRAGRVSLIYQYPGRTIR
jgi:hypothetical protein